MNKKTSNSGKAFIKSFEGKRLVAYDDGTGVWTIGCGTIKYPNGKAVKKGDVCTDAQVDQYFSNDLVKFENSVNSLVKVPLTQNQFDALVCFVFNVGRTNFKTSTLLKFINEQLWDKIPKQFMRWVYHDKKLIKGLENRRKIEVRLWNNENIT